MVIRDRGVLESEFESVTQLFKNLKSWFLYKVICFTVTPMQSCCISFEDLPVLARTNSVIYFILKIR